MTPAEIRRAAFEEAAKLCERKAQAIYDECGITDPETGERMIPGQLMDTVEAYEDDAATIRACAAEKGKRRE